MNASLSDIVHECEFNWYSSWMWVCDIVHECEFKWYRSWMWV